MAVLTKVGAGGGWIAPTGIAPPREHLELGDRVTYHHRAAVARRFKPDNSGPFHSGPYWATVGPGRSDWFGGWHEENLDPLRGISTAGSKNKTVVIWPEEGSGILIAMIRRGIGESVRGYAGGYFEEPEPGYFAVEAWVWLYAIKTHLSSLDFVLTPIWATQQIIDL